jgi:hypothetical protein
LKASMDEIKLQERATQDEGEVVNIFFEKRLFNLLTLLHRITRILDEHHIPHELICGLAVTVYVEEASPEHTPLTRDVDLMIHRSDLERTKAAASGQGFRFRHTAGVDMLIHGPAESARNAVHLVFSGEKVTSNQAVPNPPIRPMLKQVEGQQVMVIPVGDLIQMKLSAYRLNDQVHIQAMDAAGLITPEVEKLLTPEVLARLNRIRMSE